jgi:ABC-type enterochelin transport system permease subunit
MTLLYQAVKKMREKEMCCLLLIKLKSLIGVGRIVSGLFNKINKLLQSLVDEDVYYPIA